jgi:hypothetical protein
MSGRKQVVIAFALMTLVFAGLLYRAEHRTDQTNERITKATSPCLLYGPHSELCQRSFEKAVLTITHPESCAIERKAGTLRAIRELAAGLDVTFTEPCAGARLAQERQRGNERAATSRAHSAEPDGGHSPTPTERGSTDATGGFQPSKGGGTKPPASGNGGSKVEEAPAKSPAAEPEAPPTSSTPAPTEASDSEEEAPGLIGNPGGAIGKLTCGLGEVVTEVAGVPVCSSK